MMPNRLEPELDIYQYPEHLRACLAPLPKGPGVYLFHGEAKACRFTSVKASTYAAA